MATLSIGSFTSCCADLFGTGSGAQRAMILHPDIQPIVVRDETEYLAAQTDIERDRSIKTFGIIYVNRGQGYAVVNDWEMNKELADNFTSKDTDEVKDFKAKNRKANYEAAMKGIDAFCRQYNLENPDKPITRVHSGFSPNWKSLDSTMLHTMNNMVRANPKGEKLSAPDFSEFAYLGGEGMWRGDWHEEQHEIWNIENGINNKVLEAKQEILAAMAQGLENFEQNMTPLARTAWENMTRIRLGEFRLGRQTQTTPTQTLAEQRANILEFEATQTLTAEEQAESDRRLDEIFSEIDRMAVETDADGRLIHPPGQIRQNEEELQQ